MDKKGKKDIIVLVNIDKADEIFIDATLLAEKKRWRSCVNRLYYACFYIVYALLMSKKIGLNTKTHSGLKTLFGEHFVKAGIVDKELGIFYSNIFRLRSDGDYEDMRIFTEEQVAPLIPQVEKFISTIKTIITNSDL